MVNKVPHHETYLLNYAQHHKDVLRSGCIAPQNFNLGTRWRLGY